MHIYIHPSSNLSLKRKSYRRCIKRLLCCIGASENCKRNVICWIVIFVAKMLVGVYFAEALQDTQDFAAFGEICGAWNDANVDCARGEGGGARGHFVVVKTERDGNL